MWKKAEVRLLDHGVVFHDRAIPVDLFVRPGRCRPPKFRCKRGTMGLANIRDFMHAHCRFRLRSGREVFGVVWEDGSQAERRLRFASLGDYERSHKDPQHPIEAIPMLPEEILLAERLAE